MLYISFNYRELHRLKEAVFAPHMVNAGYNDLPSRPALSSSPRDRGQPGLDSDGIHVFPRPPWLKLALSIISAIRDVADRVKQW